MAPVRAAADDDSGGAIELLGLVAAAIFTTDAGAVGSDLPDPRSVDAGTHAWAFVQTLPRLSRWQIRGLLRALEQGSRLRTARPFSRLDDSERAAIMVALASSSLSLPRMAFAGLKQVCAMGYLRHPAVWAAIGYDGPSLLRIPPAGR